MDGNENIEKMFKDAYEQLLLKDEIIRGLQNHLNTEREDNSQLRKKLNELENRLSLDDPIEFNQTNTNENFNFKKTLILNHDANDNLLKDKYFNSSGGKNINIIY